MEGINKSIMLVSQFMSQVVVSNLSSLWTVLTSLVAGACLLA